MSNTPPSRIAAGTTQEGIYEMLLLTFLLNLHHA
jgi:hypothetical protein